MSEREEVVALKAQNELLKTLLAQKEAELKAATIDTTELRKDLVNDFSFCSFSLYFCNACFVESGCFV